MNHASLGDNSLPPWPERVCQRDRPDRAQGLVAFQERCKRLGLTLEETKSGVWPQRCLDRRERRHARSRSWRKPGADASPLQAVSQ
jgi:hypothetical protein